MFTILVIEDIGLWIVCGSRLFRPSCQRMLCRKIFNHYIVDLLRGVVKKIQEGGNSQDRSDPYVDLS